MVRNTTDSRKFEHNCNQLYLPRVRLNSTPVLMPYLDTTYEYGIPTGTKLHALYFVVLCDKLYKSVLACIIFHCAVCTSVTV